MRRLLIVRHGQSSWNATRRLQGQADTPLSDFGRRQAQAMAPLIAAMRPTMALCSDLTRTRETAALLGYPDATQDPRLREIDVGEWSGRSIAELVAEDAEAFRGWRAGTHTPPGGESWSAFRARASSVITGLPKAETNDERVLVVAHGGVIRVLLDVLLGISPGSVVPVEPAGLTVLRLGAGNGAAPAALEIYNRTADSPRLDPPD